MQGKLTVRGTRPMKSTTTVPKELISSCAFSVRPRAGAPRDFATHRWMTPRRRRRPLRAALMLAPWAAAADECEPRAASCSASWAARLSASAPAAVSAAAINTFWGDGSHLEYFVERLAAEFKDYKAFIDIGAAIYDRDDQGMGTFKFIKMWSSSPNRKVVVHAFEPTTGTPLEQHERVLDGTVRVHHSVVSDRSGEITMYGTGATATTNARLLIHPRWAHQRVQLRRVNSTTIDELVAGEAIAHVDLMKIDVEGAEWEALLGAHHLLARQGVSVLLFEYSLSWSSSTYYAANPPTCRPRATIRDTTARLAGVKKCKEDSVRYTPTSVRTMQPPSLYTITRALSHLAYESYLIGSAQMCRAHCQERSHRGSAWRAKARETCRADGGRPETCTSRLQFVPLSGGCWNDTFELGFEARQRYVGLRPAPYTWYDVVAVRAGSAEHRLIQSLACSAGSEASFDRAKRLVEAGSREQRGRNFRVPREPWPLTS